MYKFLIAICFCIPYLCAGQYYRYDLGVSAPVYFRPSQAHTYSNGYHWFGAFGLDGVLRINGTEEQAMGMELNAGIAEDMRIFGIDADTKFKTGIFFVNINPTATIPSGWKGVRFCLGIGALIWLGQNETVVTSSASQSFLYISTNLDSMDKLLNAHTRPVMPYISLGISRELTTHIGLEFTIRPTLLNLYDPGTRWGDTLSYIDLSYQPVYVGFRLSYFFRKAS